MSAIAWGGSVFLAWWVLWCALSRVAGSWPEIQPEVAFGFLAGTCAGAWVAAHLAQRRAGRFAVVAAVAALLERWPDIAWRHGGRGPAAALAAAGALSLLAALIAFLCGEAPRAHRLDMALMAALLAMMMTGALRPWWIALSETYLRGRFSAVDLAWVDWPFATVTVLALAAVPPAPARPAAPNVTRSASSSRRSTSPAAAAPAET